MPSESQKLTLRVIEGTGTKHVIRVSAADTLKSLFELVQEKVENNAVVGSLSVGFPPRTIQRPEMDENDGATLEELGIVNQDTIRVVLVASSVVHQEEPKGTAVAPKKQKRKAAQKATESFAETIQAQDELMKELTTKPNAQRKQRTSPSKQSAPNTVNHHIFRQSEGRRLQDGIVVTPRKRQRLQQHPQLSAEDPSLALLGTLNDSSKGARLLRKGWKSAVSNAYEQNQAVARLNDPHIQLTKRNDQLEVSYSKGVQGRGVYEEKVQFLPRDVLQSVICNIYPSNQDALRPENLALLSPRVLFCIMYHCNSNNIETGLSEICPDLNWSFLRRRHRTLSAKARENLRQQEETREDMEAAAAAIESVELSMENLEAYSVRYKREPTPSSKWRLTTPTEQDLDELQTCIETNPPEDIKASIDLLLKNGINNWRQLANVEDLDYFDGKRSIDWIQKAREESLGEIMFEICEGQLEKIDILSDHKCGTPMDLSFWATIPECLAEEVQRSEGPSVDELREWTQRAARAVKDFPWLELYTTPID